eukprot:gene12795-17155_t
MNPTVLIHTFENVQNSNWIMQNLQEFSFEQLKVTTVIVDMSLIASLFHIEAACAKAISNYHLNTKKTDSLESEIIYCLSSSKQISEAIKQYSLKPSSNMIGVIDIFMEANSFIHNSSEINQINIRQSTLSSKINGEYFNPNLLTTGKFLTPEKLKLLMQYFRITQQEFIISNSIDDGICTRLATKDYL